MHRVTIAMLVSILLVSVTATLAQQHQLGCRSNATWNGNYPEINVSFFPGGLSPEDCQSNVAGTQTCKTVVAYSVWDGSDECSVQVGHVGSMTNPNHARVSCWCNDGTNILLGNMLADDDVDIWVTIHNGLVRIHANFFNLQGQSITDICHTGIANSQVTKVGVEARAGLAVNPVSRFEPSIHVSSFTETEWTEFSTANNPYEFDFGSDCQSMFITQ